MVDHTPGFQWSKVLFVECTVVGIAAPSCNPTTLPPWRLAFAQRDRLYGCLLGIGCLRSEERQGRISSGRAIGLDFQLSSYGVVTLRPKAGLTMLKSG